MFKLLKLSTGSTKNSKKEKITILQRSLQTIDTEEVTKKFENTGSGKFKKISGNHPW